MFPMSSVESHNRPPLRENILTVGMPGVTSTRAQLARYTADEGFNVLRNDLPRTNRNSTRSSCRILVDSIRYMFSPRVRSECGIASSYMNLDTGSMNDCPPPEDWEEPLPGDGADEDIPVFYHAYSPIAPRLLHNVMASLEMEEISNTWSWNPFHWIFTLKDILTLWFFSTCVRPRHHAHCEAGGSCVGGTRDQAAFRREVERAVRQLESTPQKHLVLFGCSRGATTCFYASMKLPQRLASRVSLVIVEAPFDTMDHVMDTSCWFPSLARWFFRNFCDYRGEEDARMAYSYDAEKVALRCPVAFVISIKDKRVPNVCTEVLIEGLRRNLVPHKIPAVEVLVLKHSRHPTMPVGCKEDQDAYVRFTEMLYDKYCS